MLEDFILGLVDRTPILLKFVGTPCLAIWTLVLLFRKRPRSDALAYGLIKALYLTGLLVATHELIFSYFCLCGMRAGRQQLSMAFVSVAHVLQLWLYYLVGALLLLFGVILRYRTQPAISGPGLLMLLAATATYFIQLGVRIAFVFPTL